MKKTIITVATCFLAFMSSAQNQQTPSNQFSEVTSQESKTELVEDVDGIHVFYSKSEEGGNTFLSIKFKNTTKEPVSFHWSIVRENGLSYKSAELITIKPGKTFTESTTLEMKGSQEFKAYPIQLTLK